SVAVCIFSTWQNAETKLISNGLRFIFTCPLFLAQPITFHGFRHSYATTICLSNGVPIETLSRMMGHTSIRSTQIYAKITAEKVSNDMERLAKQIESMEQFICQTI
ncbi:tyrosine-type recombinase/integrase, partial [uncultured Bacteroides sp.]|uniref:tyrosine-type recombinase/integrase n=1 Tax=uncultured Bacteroides sp. TaxID=162156 RepID=UPI0025A98171